MVQILEEAPSFGSTFARNLGKGLTGGLEQGLSIAQKLAGQRTKKLEGRQKLAGRAYKDLESYYKSKYGSADYLRPDEKGKFEKIYTTLLLEHPDLPEQDARELADQVFSQDQNSQQSQMSSSGGFSDWINRKAPTQSSFSTSNAPLGNLGEAIAGHLRPASEIAKEKPHQLYKELPTALMKSIEGLTQSFHPEKAAVNVANMLLGDKGIKGFGEKAPQASKLYGQLARKGLSPEQAEKSEKLAEVESVAVDLFGPGLAQKLLSKGRSLLGLGKAVSKGAEINPEVLNRMKQAKASQMAVPAEVAASEYSPLKAASLEGRVTPATKTATDLRISRAEPTKKISPIQEIVKTRKEQLKAYPKYSEEIAKDAAERAIRREKLIPKTVKGRDNLKLRIHAAEKALPQIQDAYIKASSRVRALENEMSKLTQATEKARYNDLYKVAKEELKEASVDLEKGLSNIRHGSEKALVSESKEAVRKKLDDIRLTIEKGEEVKLKGYDYSPKMIGEAKEIAKRKALPNLRQDDFYNQIHERYVKPYRQRLEQISAELKEARGAGDWKFYENLKKENDVIAKMVKSAEAEQLRHTHKLGLRDIAEAKRAKDRFEQLQHVKGPTGSSEVAQEKMWRNQIREAKTYQERAKVIEKGVDEIAAKHPEKAREIIKEGEDLKSSWEKLKEGIGEKSEKQIIKDIHIFASKYPQLAKYGSDFLMGAGLAIVDDFLHENGIPIPLAALTSFAGVGFRRAGARGIGNALTRVLISEIHLSKAKAQYLSSDPKERRKFLEQKKSRQTKAKKEIYKR